MLIVADSAIPYLDGLFEPFADVVRLDGGKIGPADVRHADALIVRTRTRCDAGLLSGSRVKLIATATIGFDHIDTLYCRRRGIAVATAAGCNAGGVLQWVAAALVELLARRGAEPGQLTLGVVGAGNVGSLVQRHAEVWGFRVLCCDPPRQMRGQEGFVPLERIVAESDIITLHVPLDNTTRHMADSRFFRSLRPGCMLLNSSRGEVVDTAALTAAGLDCAIDVWENEPLIDRRLLAQAVVATPHIAGYSAQGKANATAAAVRAVASHFTLPVQFRHPAGTEPVVRRPIGWQELCASIGSRFDIAAQTRQLKSHPEQFEHMRDSYLYRQEYF